MPRNKECNRQEILQEMKAEEWRKMIKEIVNDDERLDLLAQLLEEAEEAKQVLRDKGYGWTGLSLLATVKEEVPSAKIVTKHFNI